MALPFLHHQPRGDQEMRAVLQARVRADRGALAAEQPDWVLY